MARWAAAGLLSESPEDSKGEQPPPSPPVPTTQRQRQQQVTAPAPDRPWQPDLRPRDDDTYAEMGSMQSSLDATQGQLPATHLPHGQQLGSWGAPEPGRPQPSPGGQPALLQPGSGGRGCSKPAVAEGPQAWGQYLGDSGGGGGEEGRASRPLLPPGLPKAGGPKQQLERGPLLHGPGPVERFGEGPGKGAAGGGRWPAITATADLCRTCLRREAQLELPAAAAAAAAGAPWGKLNGGSSCPPFSRRLSPRPYPHSSGGCCRHRGASQLWLVRTGCGGGARWGHTLWPHDGRHRRRWRPWHDTQVATRRRCWWWRRCCCCLCWWRFCWCRRRCCCCCCWSCSRRVRLPLTVMWRLLSVWRPPTAMA